ncbi:MAG: hypothetical protein ACJA0Q_002269, partial [Saprospiraceae bacterium]
MRNLLLLLFLSANITFAQHSIIPEPVSHKFTSDTFLLNGAF